MQFLIFFCYELIVCPLIFKSNKVYFASSLIAKPSKEGFKRQEKRNVIYDLPLLKEKNKTENMCQRPT